MEIFTDEWQEQHLLEAHMETEDGRVELIATLKPDRSFWVLKVESGSGTTMGIPTLTVNLDNFIAGANGHTLEEAKGWAQKILRCHFDNIQRAASIEAGVA